MNPQDAQNADHQRDWLLNANRATGPTTAALNITPFDKIHFQVEERAKWAKLCMPKLWDEFVKRCALAAFGEADVIGGRKLRNLYGSVEEFRKLFDQAVAEYFDVSLKTDERNSK